MKNVVLLRCHHSEPFCRLDSSLFHWPSAMIMAWNWMKETSSQFLSLFHSITVTLQPNGYDKLTVPYDLFCPSVSALVAKRTCNACKLYFPSNVMLVQHKQAVHPKHKIAEVPKCRPVRITATTRRVDGYYSSRYWRHLFTKSL